MLTTLALTLSLASKPQPVLPTKIVLPEVHAQPDFDTEVLLPLQKLQAEAAAKEQAATTACEAAGGTYNEKHCVYPIVSHEPVYSVLNGSYGYSLAWGNCVNEPGVNNPRYGNPIDWPVLYSQPSIGATVLFTWNHTAVVAGIWSNGDVEVRQQNSGGSSRIPASEIRGYR